MFADAIKLSKLKTLVETNARHIDRYHLDSTITHTALLKPNQYVKANSVFFFFKSSQYYEFVWYFSRSYQILICYPQFCMKLERVDGIYIELIYYPYGGRSLLDDG